MNEIYLWNKMQNNVKAQKESWWWFSRPYRQEFFAFAIFIKSFAEYELIILLVIKIIFIFTMNIQWAEVQHTYIKMFIQQILDYPGHSGE